MAAISRPTSLGPRPPTSLASNCDARSWCPAAVLSSLVPPEVEIPDRVGDRDLLEDVIAENRRFLGTDTAITFYPIRDMVL